MLPIARTPTTLVIGFLGAGKTTLINRLLRQKQQANWAILVNEFGKIGIDGKLFDGDDTVAIKEVSGGCICCTSQLPLHIALAQLLATHRPDHLIIEPTGLAHADELIEQLGTPRWQASIQLHAIICTLNAAQWQQENYRTDDSYQAHVKCADIIVINRTDIISDEEKIALDAWLNAINPTAQILVSDDISTSTLAQCLHAPHHQRTPKNKTSLVLSSTRLTHTPQPTANATDNTAPPYRYHEMMAGLMIGGWRLPASWVFRGYELQKWLLNLPNYARIKGVVHTDEGWLRLNITPQSVSISDTQAQDDSRLELILHKNLAWDDIDQALMELIVLAK